MYKRLTESDAKKLSSLFKRRLFVAGDKNELDIKALNDYYTFCTDF